MLSLFVSGVRYARKAIDLDKMNGDAHKWYGILKGMQNEFVPINQKIVIAMEFKKHIDIALKYKYNDYLLHHLLGRFKYEVRSISLFAVVI